MKIFKDISIIAILIIVAFILLFFSSCHYTTDAQDTVFKEFKVSTLLKKYEYFKDVSAQLDKKVSDIGVYEVRLKSIETSYGEVKRSEWAREDREQYNLSYSELAGVKSSYNSLAAEYNAAMSKFNYSFCNVGSLPQGATNPLPREYKPYINQ